MEDPPSPKPTSSLNFESLCFSNISAGLSLTFSNNYQESDTPQCSCSGRFLLFRSFIIAPQFISQGNFRVFQTMLAVFVNSRTIASLHFNSSTRIKSKPVALLFARALSLFSVLSLEISFIETSASSVALFNSLTKSSIAR